MTGINFSNLQLGQHIRCLDQGGSGPSSCNPNIVVGRPYQLIGWSTPSGERVGTTNPQGTGLVTIQVGPENRNSRNGWWNLKPSSVELYIDGKDDEQQAQQQKYAHDMLKSIADISNDYHDVVVVADGIEMTAPGLLLAAASPVLKAMLSSPMKESQSRRIELQDARAETVQECLRYITSGALTAEGCLLADLAALADQYALPSLLGAALEKMVRDVRPESVAAYIRAIRRLPTSDVREEAYARLSKRVRETDELFDGMMEAFVPNDVNLVPKRITKKRKVTP